MKAKIQLFLLTILMAILPISAQVRNGSYTSDKTTYQDKLDATNNFVELTKNNVFIEITNDRKEGVFIFQDPRIPEKVLSYGILSFNKYETEDQLIFIYKCEVIHIPDQPKTEIVIYWNKQGVMNIMITDQSSSQVFHDLKFIN